jgi:hypothetical protein
MAIERSSMKNFFAAMGSQMMGGYGAKTISTPMGPFQWDDNLQVWVNTNNGMQMNNIAFQDAMAMLDYNNESGDESQFVCTYSIQANVPDTININVKNDNITPTLFPAAALTCFNTCPTVLVIVPNTLNPYSGSGFLITVELTVDGGSNWIPFNSSTGKATIPAGSANVRFRTFGSSFTLPGVNGDFGIKNESDNLTDIIETVNATLIA